MKKSTTALESQRVLDLIILYLSTRTLICVKGQRSIYGGKYQTPI